MVQSSDTVLRELLSNAPPLFASLLRWLVVLGLLTAGVFCAGLSARAQIILTISPLGVLYAGLNMVHSFNAED
ncbi:hypothetical protein [Pseudovibrio denitrificans]|uniref:hypothetical protein n=1 Tax=Pseudovibrio denitrificans TaxID=258256 RepID=UPI0006D0A897|nr:hypothetical protein [Pseudovibrio denitrificans]